MEGDVLYREIDGGIECMECKKQTMFPTPILHKRHCVIKVGFSRLSPKEMSVARELAQGLNLKDIATKFNLSTKTIESHKFSLMRKLHVHSTAELVRRYIYEVEFPELAKDNKFAENLKTLAASQESQDLLQSTDRSM